MCRFFLCCKSSILVTKNTIHQGILLCGTLKVIRLFYSVEFHKIQILTNITDFVWPSMHSHTFKPISKQLFFINGWMQLIMRYIFDNNSSSIGTWGIMTHKQFHVNQFLSTKVEKSLLPRHTHKSYKHYRPMTTLPFSFLFAPHTFCWTHILYIIPTTVKIIDTAWIDGNIYSETIKIATIPHTINKSRKYFGPCLVRPFRVIFKDKHSTHKNVTCKKTFYFSCI